MFIYVLKEQIKKRRPIYIKFKLKLVITFIFNAYASFLMGIFSNTIDIRKGEYDE